MVMEYDTTMYAVWWNVIRTHYDWPLQMHTNFLINSQNTSDSECFDEARFDGSVAARSGGG